MHGATIKITNYLLFLCAAECCIVTPTHKKCLTHLLVLMKMFFISVSHAAPHYLLHGSSTIPVSHAAPHYLSHGSSAMES